MKLAFSKGVNYVYLGTANLRSAIADLFTLRAVIWYGSAALLLNLAGWFLTFALRRALGDELAVLHYNITFGIDRIGETVSLFEMPLAGLAILIFNLILSSFSRQKAERLIVHALLAMAVVGNGIILVSLYSIYLINIS